jgi:predicted nucleic acid-binding protein
VTERWILNSSPLIALGRIGYTDLFSKLSTDIAIPRAVADEIKAGPTDDRAYRALLDYAHCIVDTNLSPEVLAWDLGAGETAVISYALTQPGWKVILDDAMARKCARSFELQTKGTLAVVIMAKQRGLIPSATDVLHSLLKAEFRLDEEVIREALLRTVGEVWR